MAAARPALRRAIPSLRSSTFLPHHHQRPQCLHHHVTISQRSLSTSSPFCNDTQTTTSSPSSDRETHFGFSTVTESQKRQLVASVFTSVADSYDKMNDLMSFGWHRIWKDHFVSTLNPGFAPLSSSDPSSPQHILDIAGGTGDIAFRMLHHAHTVNSNPNVNVTISDINRAMLSVGKSRSAELPASQQAALSFVEANAEDLSKTRPLTPILSQSEQTFFDPATATSSIPDNSVDLYTVAFGIRNFSDIPAALREANRVLKPGGIFACLEFSKADRHPLFNSVYKEWSFRAIPLIGQLVAGDRDSYQYLVESIERFPRQEEFRDMILDAGFKVSGQGWEDLTGGVAAIHRGMKPRV
ncbi:putative mitochondrial ubiquinone biosynthesis methyltransferase coq5 precursor [Triangularia verruculosa]|uniref:2-methoxy-6-polyprenyl-1,4-benzoquinol methylase, mitochondrial n=1 Tax=Triangularia verruculosa TaxID=2587418 RepID=A0AAN6XGG4_9PEZI|nr:putative mitochondrial ubiquinone biosynthesis methyltransferase coq5 precursor [Triangularia verruculosa]